MAHIPPSAAIFSPSVARLASSAAKDWNYVDNWLVEKFPGRSPPPFERNSETLKALVTLAALNETVDDDRQLLVSAESSVLQTLTETTIDDKHASNDGNAGTPALSTSPAIMAENIRAAIEGALSREGRLALDSLAATSVELGVAYPTPDLLGRKVAESQTRLFQLEQALLRTSSLSNHVGDESTNLQYLSNFQEHPGCRPSSSLAKANIELQRKVKRETARIQEASNKSSGLRLSLEVSVPLIEEEEAAYLSLLAYDEVLCKQIQYFENPPSDKNLARQR
ncbi:hypothetical protein SEPCBS119000_006119 [Sporothrix epigloea]|uniref:HAUS augmin-like complex subunit 1 n=1 Tax=Sporothrix epigloea TaxID=1892477 RepID=A0ABP0E197_9PEZI